MHDLQVKVTNIEFFDLNFYNVLLTFDGLNYCLAWMDIT